MNEGPVFNLSDARLWVPVYLPLLRGPGKHGHHRRKILYGSRDSAKSHFVAQAIIRRMLQQRFKGLLCRKVYDQIKESQYQTIREIIEGWGWGDFFEFRSAPLQIICKVTGARLMCMGLDKPGKAKSLKDVSLVWYEEFDELEQADFTQTTLSIRGKDIEEWFTFNSPTTDHWILKRFFPVNSDGEPDLSFEEADGRFHWVQSTDPKTVILHTTYLDNPYCNADRRAEYDWMARNMPEEYRTSGMGLMGRRNVGSLWMRAFNRNDHLRPVEFDPNYPVHMTFDQNNLPYSTMLAIQEVPVGELWEIRVIREYCLAPPQNTTEDLCAEFTYDFGDSNPECYIYGDPTGRNEVQRRERNELAHHYDAVKKHLAPYLHNRSMRVGPSAPSIKGRQRFMSVWLSEGTYLRLVVDPSCKRLIGDFEHLAEDTNGGYIKKRVKDKETGQTWEERGHCFVGSTLVSTDRGPLPIESIEPGMMVWTRFGLRPVQHRFDNGTRLVHRFNIAGHDIECTADHKIFTHNRGFVPVRDLVEGDTVEKHVTCTSYSTGTNSPDTRTAQGSVINDTTEAEFRSMAGRSRFTYIGTCGRFFADLYRMASTCITWMGIPRTTPLKTWLAWKRPNTFHTMQTPTGAIPNSDPRCSPISSASSKLQSHGTAAQRERHGIPKMQEPHSQSANHAKSNALSVGTCTPPPRLTDPTHAATSAGDCSGTRTPKGANTLCVSNAAPVSQPHVLDASDIAALHASASQGRECPVHDLHVLGHHEYYANGILVHNCMDSLINYIYQGHGKVYRAVAKV